MFPLVSYTNLLDPYDPPSESIGQITDKLLTNIGCSVQESSESLSFNYIFELSPVRYGVKPACLLLNWTAYAIDAHIRA